MVVHGQVKDAGNYILTMNDKTRGSFSFNFNRRESDLNCAGSEELKSLAAQSNLKNISILEPGRSNIALKIEEMNEGKKLWKLCIIFALAFFGIAVVFL